MQNSESRRILKEIGHLLSEDTTYSGKDTLLHAALEMNCVAAAVFTDLGDHILNRENDLRLDYALLDLWDAQEPDKRWAEIEYFVRDGKFQVGFTYPDEIDAERDPLDHRDIVIERYFGKKPIVYPPPPKHAMEFKPRSNLRRPMRGKLLP